MRDAVKIAKKAGRICKVIINPIALIWEQAQRGEAIQGLYCGRIMYDLLTHYINANKYSRNKKTMDFVKQAESLQPKFAVNQFDEPLRRQI